MPLSAYQLEEHKLLTHLSFTHYTSCTDDSFTKEIQHQIVEHNINEDIDLLNKWLFYSHYYHPYKDIQMRRYESDVRVKELEEDIIEELSFRNPDWSLIYNAIGAAIHHIQDMTSPSHVAPITHHFYDGYETYIINLENHLPLKLHRKICEEVVKKTDEHLKDILHETALFTYQKIKEPLMILQNNLPYNTTWQAFWKEAKKPVFGNYGWLGNSFGILTVKIQPHEYRMSHDLFDEFKSIQMTEALKSTLRAYQWLHRSMKNHRKLLYLAVE